MIPTASILLAAGLQVWTGYPPPGHPKLFVRYPRARHWRQRLVWQELTPVMWERMQAAGIVSGFLEGSSGFLGAKASGKVKLAHPLC